MTCTARLHVRMTCTARFFLIYSLYRNGSGDGSESDEALKRSIRTHLEEVTSSANALRQFEKAMLKLNMVVRPTQSDGNCFFRATGKMYTHHQLRSMLIEHLQSLSQVNFQICTKH